MAKPMIALFKFLYYKVGMDEETALKLTIVIGIGSYYAVGLAIGITISNALIPIIGVLPTTVIGISLLLVAVIGKSRAKRKADEHRR